VAGLAVNTPGDLSLRDQMAEVRADVLGPEVFGRGVVLSDKLGGTLGVDLDCPGGAVAERQVLDRAAAQQCQGLLVLMEGATRSEESRLP
jgi:hypothetical protein